MGGKIQLNDSFDVVYYSQPVPPSLRVLTFLACLFDKIHFPAVFIPDEGFDPVETQKEIDRLSKLGIRDFDDAQCINIMIYALHKPHLNDFCVFTGKDRYMPTLEEGAEELMRHLGELVYGPFRPDFTPTYKSKFVKSLPGGGDTAVSAPGAISYPANAFIYSAKHSIPLLNDDPGLPVPALGKTSPIANAKLLATILSIECIKFLIPNLKSLTPEQIVEFRAQTIQYVKPFRLKMLRLAKDLNSAINPNMSPQDIEKEARFLVETTVYPEVEELRQALADPQKPWYRHAIDFGKSVPELAICFTSMPLNIAMAKSLASIAAILGDSQDNVVDRKRKIAQSGMYYLLKLEETLGGS
jgi:hypothetical protein